MFDNKMGQIVNINIGQAGVRIGEKFLQKVAAEHFNQNQTKGKFNVFFKDSQSHREARSFFLDMDSRIIDKIQTKKKDFSINQRNFFSSNKSYLWNYGIGMYNEGPKIIEQMMQNIRKQVQLCDCFSGFLVSGSFGGSGSSGLTARLLIELRENYCQYIVQDYNIVPQTQPFYNPIQIYNSIFSMHLKIQYSDICHLLENQAANSNLKRLGNINYSLEDTNNVFAQNLCQKTSAYRFGGNLNSSPRKICTNLVLFPRLKFMVDSYSITKSMKQSYLENTLNSKNILVSNFFQTPSPRYDIYAMHVHCRDNFIFQSQIDSNVRFWLDKNRINFCEWMPHSIHLSLGQQVNNNPSGSMTLNSSHVVNVFKKWSELFSVSYRRRAFVHTYLNQGIDQMQFIQTQSNLNDLISEYHPCCMAQDEDMQYEVDQDFEE